MERTSSMKGRGKRSLEDGEEAAQEPDRKRNPPLASVIVEALKMDTVQKICSSFEPIIRKVVSEVVERALAKLVPARLEGRSSPPEPIEGLYGRNLQLQFKSRLSLPLFTGGRIEGEQSAAIHVVLVDANTGHVVTSGPESSLKLDVIVVEGDFNNEGWGQEEFESHVVNEREGKRPLLTGDLQVTLKEGVGTLGDITFTDNSSWIKSRKFRLGLKVGSGYCERVREAMTEAFTVKDHRGELYRKHYPPALNDDVWRLEKIGKDGSFHKRLKIAGIYSVEDFLRMVVRNPQKLRSILGSGMSNKMWDALIRHSKTCILSGKLYVYYPDDSSNLGVAFNNIFQLSGLIAQDQYYPQDLLSDNQKVCVDAWVEKAYENWGEVVEYDGKSLFNLKQVQKSSMPRNDFPLATRNYSHPLDNQTQPQSFLIPSETSSMDHNILIRGSGYNTNHMIAGYSTESHLINPSSCNEFELTSFTQPSTPNQINHSTYENEVGLALGSFEDWPADCNNGIVNEIFPEEEICMTSNKMLENEDMQQQLLRILNMGGHASVDGSPPEDVFNIPSNVTLPSHGFDYAENQAHPVAGWLKIKSVMRWSIFIRKLVAKNRAHVAELEDK